MQRSVLTLVTLSLLGGAAGAGVPGYPRSGSWPGSSGARGGEPGREAARAREAIRLGRGPHLFLDERLIERSENVVRRICTPKRDLPGPVVTGPEDKNFQPYMTVVRDAKTGRFRVWYGTPVSSNQSHLATMESEDGIRWMPPHRLLQDPRPIQFGAAVIDEGPEFPDAARRYKFGWYGAGGLDVAASPDGIRWTPLAPEAVLKHNHDINSIHRDPIRKRYVAFVSSYVTGPTWSGQRRIPMQSVSDDLVRWKPPWTILTPDAKDEGETQFYCMSGLLARGDTLVALLKVLRDDLPADAGGPVAGIGYTVLAWSHDGEHWTRDREPFFDRSPDKGAWDHAMAWMDCQLPVGDQVYIYYGGYARGHKVERFTERQIGLVRMPRDRYVAREAGEAPGSLRTPLVRLAGGELALNVDARQGEVRAQLVDANGRPLPGFRFADCDPIRVDSLSARVRWKRRLGGLGDRDIRLEFSLQRARLFAFEFR